MGAKMDGLKNNLKSYMEGLKNNMKSNMEDMKYNLEYFKNSLRECMEGFQKGLRRLLQEMLPNGKMVLDESHNENKRNVNHDFIDSNIRSKTQPIPKFDMRKFDGKDLVTWILLLEQYFDIHNVKTHTKGMHCNVIFGTQSICMVSMTFVS